MSDDLAAAVRAYQAAAQHVERAEQALSEARDQVPEARRKLHTAIVRATESGMRQTDIVAATGYNRETVRRILRAAGVEP